MYVTSKLVNVKGCASISKPPYIALDRKEALQKRFWDNGSAEAQIEANDDGWVAIEQLVSTAEGTDSTIGAKKRFASRRPVRHTRNRGGQNNAQVHGDVSFPECWWRGRQLRSSGRLTRGLNPHAANDAGFCRAR